MPSSKASLLDIEPNTAVAIRKDGMLAAFGVNNDIEPVCEPVRIEPVGILRINGQRGDTQGVLIDARIPEQPRVG